MEFRIADTFTGSLARPGGDEQKAVKTTTFDLQLDLDCDRAASDATPRPHPTPARAS
jgi:hypothetical protein